jgi:hypothetical protein
MKDYGLAANVPQYNSVFFPQTAGLKVPRSYTFYIMQAFLQMT